MLVFRLTPHGIQVGRQDTPEHAPEALGVVNASQDGHYRIPPRLASVCKPDELRSLETWLAELDALRQQTVSLRDTVDALTLAEELARAARWFATAAGHPHAGLLALRIANAMRGLEECMDRLAPTPPDPADPIPPMAPKTGMRGRLSQVLPRRITGWAIRLDAAEPAEVRLIINDTREIRILADQPRPDIRAQGLHPTGNCGFRIRLDADEALRVGDRVRTFIEPEDVELANSPASCQQQPNI